MRVLVTGGAGYLGSVLVRRLLSYKHDVKVLDNFMYGGEALIDVFSHPNLEVFNGDVRNEEDIEKAINRCDAVVHLAAIVGDPACNIGHKFSYSVNVTGSKNVFCVAKENDVRKVIFASTCSNYGKMDRNTAEYLTEDADLKPVSKYAEHKVIIEDLLLEQFADLNPTILRFATLYGISPRMRFDLTINQFAMEAVVDKYLEIYGEQFYRPYLHVYDAASCITQLFGLPFSMTSNKIWNVGKTEENYTKRDIANVIQGMGINCKVNYVRRNEDPRDYKVSFEKIKSEIGFVPLFHIGVGIDEVAELVESGVIQDPKSPKWRNS